MAKKRARTATPSRELERTWRQWWRQFERCVAEKGPPPKATAELIPLLEIAHAAGLRRQELLEQQAVARRALVAGEGDDAIQGLLTAGQIELLVNEHLGKKGWSDAWIAVARDKSASWPNVVRMRHGKPAMFWLCSCGSLAWELADDRPARSRPVCGRCAKGTRYKTPGVM